MREFDVYCRTISLLAESGWKILCASPPGGTDNRFRKCLLPRRDLGGSERGPRDELDLTAYKDGVLLLIECKVRLSHSLMSLNALGEGDVQKLERLLGDNTPEHLRMTIQRGTGQNFDPVKYAAGVVAVALVDIAAPQSVSIIETKSTGRPTATLLPPLNAGMFGL